MASRAPRAAADQFLPTTRAELAARGWDELDVLIVSGDAYVDHPAFGPVLIARWLESRGYRVGLVAQPRWDVVDDVLRMGAPRLFVGVSAGNLDSMLNKLTAQKKVRAQDPYSPGGRPGQRPNRATIVYSNLCRRAFPGLPIVLGGIEASLRRLAHYDYWSNQVRRSVLLDAKADLLVFGMAERAVAELADRLAAGEPITNLRDVRGTACPLPNRRAWEPLLATSSRTTRDRGVVVLPSYEAVASSAAAFAAMTRSFERESHPHSARPLLQAHGDEAVVLNPPALPLTTAELDALYTLPFVRRPHPSYAAGVPAYEIVRHSLVASRGCCGGCAFCSITQHEGRAVQSRSVAGVQQEARALVRHPGFGGTITDVGGPTANLYGVRCSAPDLERVCRRSSCLYPHVCRHLATDPRPFLELLRAVRRTPGVRYAFVASGVRYDLPLASPALVAELARHHTGGQLSVAPEHASPAVLARMRKPPISEYERFVSEFSQASLAAGKEQYLVPYLIVGHPGSTLADTIELALYLKRRGLRPRQVQEFIPTPMTVATAMYHTGLDPMRGDAVVVVRDPREKRRLKALLYWWDPTHQPLAREALRRAGREDLIGAGPHSLVPCAPAVGKRVLDSDRRDGRRHRS